MLLFHSFHNVAGVIDSINVNIIENDSCWIISLQNISKDTVYIFDSYFKNNYYNT